MRVAFLALIAVVVLVALLLLVARQRWQAATSEFERQLNQPGDPAAVPPPFSEADLEGLPGPVARYFRRVLKTGQRHVKLATFEQQGEFLMQPRADGWRPFEARHTATTGPPGFVWDAKIAAMPGVTARVRDAFLAGNGYMKASLLGLVTLVHTEKTPEIAQGALYRYLAEAVWLPTALLRSEGVTWLPRDPRSATAQLKVGATEVSLDFFFGADDLVERVYAKDRDRDVGGHGVPTPWQGHFKNYQEREGMFVPLDGEVEWILPEGPQPYWRGHAVTVHYQLR